MSKDYILLTISVLFYCLTYGQESISTMDTDKLNEQILNEVNYLRKKARKDSIQNNRALSKAANDHVNYMVEIDKLTHIQRRNQYKKYPKNRTDFYKSGFSSVGENVQQTSLVSVENELEGNRKVDNIYEALAKVLVENWKNSPPHYANMISDAFLYTYTEFKVGEDGKVYACQLFGGSQYNNKYLKDQKPVNYKPFNPRKCKRSSFSNSYIKIAKDGTILLMAEKKKETGFRFAWPWTEGVAADIVLLSQYECDEPNRFNPRQGVKGIPLEPVYKKEFRDIGLWTKDNVAIPLGKVPDYINEPYEINITVVSRKRTCGNTMYNQLNSKLDIEIPLYLKTIKGSPYRIKKTDSLITRKVYFEMGKSDAFINFNPDSLFPQLDTFKIDHVELIGYASIEGDFELNQALYQGRTDTIRQLLKKYEIDSSKLTIKSKENFKEFKESIHNTEFDYLEKLKSDSIKILLRKDSLRTKLEPILSKQRYVNVSYRVSHSDSVLVPRDTLIKSMIEAIDRKDFQVAEKIQKKYIGHLLKDQSIVSEELITKIPLSKQTVDLKYNFLVHNFLNGGSSISLRSRLFIEGLAKLTEMNEKNRNVNTALAYFEIVNLLNDGSLGELSSKFNSLLENKYILRDFKYRALLKLTMTHDVRVIQTDQPLPLLHPQATEFYRKAGLTIDETFSTAAFYNYVSDQATAYDIVRRVYKETNKYENLHFLLFLTGYSPGLNINQQKQVRYFEYVARNNTNHFCRYFREGHLNFQIFDTQDFKDVYCKYCDE